MVTTPDAVDHEFMSLGGVKELDHLGCLFIEMSLVIGILLNLFCWVDQFTDVDASGLDLLLQEFDQLLQVVL